MGCGGIFLLVRVFSTLRLILSTILVMNSISSESVFFLMMSTMTSISSEILFCLFSQYTKSIEVSASMKFN